MVIYATVPWVYSELHKQSAHTHSFTHINTHIRIWSASSRCIVIGRYVEPRRIWQPMLQWEHASAPTQSAQGLLFCNPSCSSHTSTHEQYRQAGRFPSKRAQCALCTRHSHHNNIWGCDKRSLPPHPTRAPYSLCMWRFNRNNTCFSDRFNRNNICFSDQGRRGGSEEERGPDRTAKAWGQAEWHCKAKCSREESRAKVCTPNYCAWLCRQSLYT